MGRSGSSSITKSSGHQVHLTSQYEGHSLALAGGGQYISMHVRLVDQS